MTTTSSAHKSAAAFVLQATPWVPLVIRRGSSSDVSVKIQPDDDDDDGATTIVNPTKAKGNLCLVWQFRVEEYDIAFQLLENGRPLQELVRFSQTGNDPTTSESADPAPSTRSYDPASVSAEGVQLSTQRGDVYTFRWDNSYSFVRHKRVFYRFVVTSQRAYSAAQTASTETQQRQAITSSGSSFRGDSSSGANGSQVKPHLAKRLALERRLTLDEVSMEQTRAIEQLQRCVTDMVGTFMTDPDRPLHEGSIREFLLSFETILRNGIKEQYLRSWPEEPYFEFLLQIETVLRDDKGLIAEVTALSSASQPLGYLGWTRARALLLLALNKNMLHYAFENLIKRRAVVETYYGSHGLLFMYSSATQIVSYLSALNGVKFLMAPYLDKLLLQETELPPNLTQCAPDDVFDGDELVGFTHSDTKGTGYILRSGETENADEMKRIEQCSIARHVLMGHKSDEVTIARGTEASIPIKGQPSGGLCFVLQLRVVPGDIGISIVGSREGREEALIEPIDISPADGWVDIVVVAGSGFHTPLKLRFDNSSAMMRARQVTFRCASISAAAFDSAWESCQGIAQSISWKHATRAGVTRCQRYMEGQLVQQQQDVVEQQQQRSRETSGTNDSETGDFGPLEDESLFGIGASLITRPVSYLVGGFLGTDTVASACAQCLTVFSFFSRQYACPSCQSVVCIPCSRHTTQLNGKGPQIKLCDRCFIKEKDAERKRRAGANGSDLSMGGECTAYAALRDDPAMDKYFKMLGFGVPHSGVAQKMLQDEMPSDKILVFSEGPAGASSLSNASTSGGSANSTDKHAATAFAASRQGNSFRKVHWKSLETKKASASIWNRETSRRKTAPIRLSPQDFEEAVHLFGAATSASKSSTSGKSDASTKKRVFTALDSRRSNNINIGLSQFKVLGGADAILASLKACDLAFLTADRLSSIYDIAPSSVEAKRYTNFRGSRSRLEPAEKFLVDMCGIPRVTEKIAAMRFVAQFESQHRELRHRIRCITQACLEILQSERLARCFELILAIGNLLNSGSEMANSGGVTLESLLKLSETKSVDQSMTLLHFIVRLIHDRGEGDVLLFLQELDTISVAKRFSNVICLSQAKSLHSGVAQVQNEIKEEMLFDVQQFEKEEEKRKKQFDKDCEAARFRSLPTRTKSHGNGPGTDGPPGHAAISPPLDPRAALMAALQKRNQQQQTATSASGTATDSERTTPPQPPANPHAALMASLQKRNQNRPPDASGNASPQLVHVSPATDTNTSTSTDTKNQSSGALPGTAAGPAGGAAPPPRNALLAAIRQKAAPPTTANDTSESTTAPEPNARDSLLASIRKPSASAPSSSTIANGPKPGGSDSGSGGGSPSMGLPPRNNLLASIRSRKPRDQSDSTSPSRDKSPSRPSEVFTPRVYSVDGNRFISVLRDRIMDMKASMEELELEVETMVSTWEATARYLGEDPSSSSSEYVLHLLNRFNLDVKIAKMLLSRQGLTFHSSISSHVQVGSLVATMYGPGTITAVRHDTAASTKLEVAFPWSRDAYLSPSAILSVGAVVRVAPFGVGILRSTQYDRGHCSVRFSFGFGVVRVQDVAPETSSRRDRLKKEILARGYRVGDPVVTPFGCGTVRGIQGHQRPAEKAHDHGAYLVVNIFPEGQDDHQSLEEISHFSATSPVAYLQLGDVKMKY